MARRRLSHVDDGGRARMVDVGAKPVTHRHAAAEGCIRMSKEAFALVKANRIAKGDVLPVAEIAGITGAKKTDELIPLCHPLPIDQVRVTATLDPKLPGVRVQAEVRVEAKTGAEMEALTACTIALLTVYDMVKAADRAMTIDGIRVLEKSGGMTGEYRVSEENKENKENKRERR